MRGGDSMVIQSKNKKFELDQAKLLFWELCTKFNTLNLFVTDEETSKSKPHDEAVTIYYPTNVKQALGSIQYYGGNNLYKKGYVRTIELRFYFNFIMDFPQLFATVNLENNFRVGNRIPYLAFQFNHDNAEVREFIEQLTENLRNTLLDIYGKDYLSLKDFTLSESIKLLPQIK
jgi:hypothetical protein